MLSSARAFLLAAAIALIPAATLAKTYPLPDPNPVAMITIPDDWEVEETDRGGLEATSEDEAVYFTAEVTDIDTIDKVTERSLAAIIAEGVTLDAASEKKADFEIAGLKGFMVFWSAKDEDGPTQVSVTVLMLSDKKALLMTGSGTEEGQKANLKELTGIMESIKAVK